MERKVSTCTPAVRCLMLSQGFPRYVLGVGSGTRFAPACVATLCGTRSYSAVAEWGHTYNEVDPALLRSLGLSRHGPPSSATIHRIFRRINVDALEWALGQWAQEAVAAVPVPAVHLEGIAMDGKTLRGTRTAAVPGLHLLAAVSHRLGLTLGQIPVGE
jgi:hypothetical protein